MCNCIDETRKMIKDKTGYYDISAHGVGLIFTEPVREQTYTEFEGKTTTQSKKGKTLIRKHKVSLLHSFCPFCGEKYPESKKDEIEKVSDAVPNP